MEHGNRYGMADSLVLFFQQILHAAVQCLADFVQTQRRSFVHIPLALLE